MIETKKKDYTRCLRLSCGNFNLQNIVKLLFSANNTSDVQLRNIQSVSITNISRFKTLNVFLESPKQSSRSVLTSGPFPLMPTC